MAQLWKTAFTVAAAQVPSTQTDFPVLLKPTDNRFKTTGNGGHVASSSGYDIRAYSDSALTTALTYQLVPGTYNASTGTFEMWVQVPSLSNGSVIYLGYGDTALTSDASSNSLHYNFKRVYHLGDGTTLSAVDSSGNQNGTFVNTPTAGTGKIGGAASFASISSQYLDATPVSGVGFAAITYEAWVNATSFPNAYNSVMSLEAGPYVSMLVKSSGKLAPYLSNGAGGNSSYDGTGANTLSTGTWYYYALTFSNATGLIGYVNASVDGTAAGGYNLETAPAPIWVAGAPLNTRYWNGALDEVRISDIARSANWITTCYNNQNAPTSFTTIGTEAVGGNPPLTATVATFTLTRNAAILNRQRVPLTAPLPA